MSEQVSVDREELLHLLRHGVPDTETTSPEDVAEWERIAASLRAALEAK